MFRDPLTVATNSLLKAVEPVRYAMDEKRRIIQEAEVSIHKAIDAVNEAKSALNM